MQEYKLVSDLIMKVLSSELTVSEALSKFPSGRKDINLKCAFDALMHYEADEDLRKNTPQYAQVQDEYLEQIAQILNNGDDMPQNIINMYLKYHKDNLVSDKKKDIKTIVDYMKRMINF
jgi:hypothetical protein